VRRARCYALPVPDPGPDASHIRVALPPDTYEVRDSDEGTVVVIHPAGPAPEVSLIFHDASTAITFAKDVLEAAGVIGYGD
jgi:hypothetical protein